MNIDAQIDLIVKLRFIIVVIGLVGNFFSFVVFSRRAFRNNSINVYCRALVLSDSTVLTVQFINLIFVIFVNNDVFSSSNALCKFSYYVFTSLSPTSGWILVIFSIDKAMCVLYPYRYDFIRKSKFQFSMIGLIVISNALFYLQVPIGINNRVTVVKGSTNETCLIWSCSLRYISFYKALSAFYLIESSLIPFSIMIVTTVVTVKALFSSRIRLESQENREMKLRRAKDMKFAATSIVLNVLYVILQSPMSLIFIISIRETNTYLILAHIASVLYYMNFSIPFFAYLLSNSIFKRELFKLFRLKYNVIESTTV